ncbi:unnamed protein product, partial [Dibothriocephalus latus]
MARYPANMGGSRTFSQVTANRQVGQAFAKDTYTGNPRQPIICVPRNLFSCCPPPSPPPPQGLLDQIILKKLLEIRCGLESIQREMCEEVSCSPAHDQVTANRQVKQAFAENSYQPINSLLPELFKYCPSPPPTSPPPPQGPLDQLTLQNLIDIRCSIESIKRKICEEIYKEMQPNPTMQETLDVIMDTARRLSTTPAYPTPSPSPPPAAVNSPSAPPPPPPAHARQSL